jgi:ATP-dependent protease HslVU (ClpYQ) peptidase subunit
MDLATPKVIENEGYLFAIAGLSRGGNLLQFGWKPPAPPNTNDVNVLDKFITTKFITAMRSLFVNQGFDMKGDGDYAKIDSVFLMAVNGVIYWIDEDYSWDRDTRGIYQHGSGGTLAASVMSALEINKCTTPAQATKIIKTAVKAATQWDIYSAPPIYTKVQIFDE